MASAFLVALSAALPLPEAVDFALARWPRTNPGVLAVTVLIKGNSRDEDAKLRTRLVGLVRGRAREAGLAQAVIEIAPGARPAARARAVGAEHLLVLELHGAPTDTLDVRIVAVDVGGLWGPWSDGEELVAVATTRVSIASIPMPPAPAGSASQALVFVPVSSVSERPLALAVCQDAERERRLVVVFEGGMITFPVRARQLGEPAVVLLSSEPAAEPVRAPFGHAVCVPGRPGAVAIGHGRWSAGVVTELSPPRATHRLTGLPLAADDHSILVGHPTSGTDILDSKLEWWRSDSEHSVPVDGVPRPPEPIRRILYDRTTGWLFVTLRGPVVDTGGREHVAQTGSAAAVHRGWALLSAPRLHAGQDWVRLWDLERRQWASAEKLFSGEVLALTLDQELAFAAIRSGATYQLHVARVVRPEMP